MLDSRRKRSEKFAARTAEKILSLRVKFPFVQSTLTKFSATVIFQQYVANMVTSLSYRKLTPSLDAINVCTCIIINVSTALRVACTGANEATACVYPLLAIPNELSFIRVMTCDIIIATLYLHVTHSAYAVSR
jgi:hypothetical protein